MNTTAIRYGWFGIAALGLGLFLSSLPRAYGDLVALRPPAVERPAAVPVERPAAVRAGLDQWGISAQTYAVALLLVFVLVAAVFVGTAVLILIRRRDDPVALLISGALLAFGVVWSNAAPYHSGTLGLLENLYESFALAGFFGLLYLFPDGQFAPRWCRWVFAVFVVYVVASRPGWWDLAVVPAWSVLEPTLGMVFLILGLESQVHRFRHVSGPMARQQTKWVVAALVVAVTGFAFMAAIGGLDVWASASGALVFDAVEVVVYAGLFCLVPLTIGRAVLRLRLWDIDPILNRALVLAGMTAALVAVFSVATVAASWAGRGVAPDSGPWVSVLAALVVAVLLSPLRHRLQLLANRATYGDRDDPQRAKAALARRVDDALAPGTVLPAVVASVRDALRSPYAALVGPTGDERATSGESAGDLVDVPLVRQGVPLGSLRVAPRAPGEEFGGRDLQLINDLARQASAAVEAVDLREQTARLVDDLNASRGRIVTAREEERRLLPAAGLAQVLTDDVGVPLRDVSARPVLDPSVPFGVHTADGEVVDLRADGKSLPGAGFRLADPDLANYVVLDFDVFDSWLEEDEPNFAHPRDPFHRIDILPSSRHVRFELDGEVLAESSHPTLLFETLLPTRYYLAREDIRAELVPTETQTWCAYKGQASYWSATVGGRVVPDLAWTYESPLREAAQVRGLVAFFDERVDITLDGQRLERPVTPWSPRAGTKAPPR